MLRKFPGLFVCIFFSLVIIGAGCAKIDTTTIGGELIPAVDNVKTFADTLSIDATQGTFPDNYRTAIADLHVLGAITNDPVFGKTQAEMFMELKPNFYPFYFGAAGDTINPAYNAATGFDSAVLCLSVKSYYGDTLSKHKFQVWTIKNSNTDFNDSLYLHNYRPDAGSYGEQVDNGITEIDPRHVGATDTTKFPGSAGTVITSQIRIKLKKDFLDKLVADKDTAPAFNGKYRNDVNFRNFLKGFAIVPDPSTPTNGLFYVNITDAATRLEVHFRKTNAGKIDTSFSSFTFFSRLDTVIGRSPQANYLQRDSSGTELVSRQPNALYILSSPGTYANLKIPGLTGYGNKIIHRAEIVMEQIPSSDPNIAEIDKRLAPPSYLYLDLINSTSSSNPFKPVYYDLNTSAFYDPDNSAAYFPSAGINFTYFGGNVRTRTGTNGDPQYYYVFNVSRHVQSIATKDSANYGFRLYAPYQLEYYGKKITFVNNMAAGRIKIGDGNNIQHKMYMRIVYSKIN